MDESSQKQIPRSANKEKMYRNHVLRQRAFKELKCMRKQDLFCDVRLVTEKVEISAHKLVLASCSSYFRAMFTSFEESKQDRIELKDVDPYALQLLIDYVYTAEINLTEDNVQVLLAAADLLQLSDVRDACCDFLRSQLHPTNCLGIRAFADLHGCIKLTTYAETFIKQYFSEVVECEEFLALSHLQVCELISSDRLAVESEEKVLECVISWVNHDVDDRKCHLEELMEYVRLPLVPQEYLLKTFEEEPLLKEKRKCIDYLLEALRYHSLNSDQRLMFSPSRIKPRQPIERPKVMLVVGDIRDAECYDFSSNTWSKVSGMRIDSLDSGIVVLQGKVYVIGGCGTSVSGRTVDVYDPFLNIWKTSRMMKKNRIALGVALLNNCICAVGGDDGSTGLNSAEMYDPRKQEWRMIASMSKKRSRVGVGVVNNLLYAVGGYDGESGQCLRSVECYCPETDQWKPVANMTIPRSDAGIGVIDGILYAVGGWNGQSVSKSIEAYNPKTNSWTPVADMAFPRKNAGVVAFNGQLYVVGGSDGRWDLASVEVYNPKTITRAMLPSSMSIRRNYVAAVIIDQPPAILNE